MRPTAERLFRTNQADLEIRSDRRTIVGLAVPFDVEATIHELGRRYTEVFRRGAFARTIAERGAKAIKFRAEHNRKSLPLGRAEALREDAHGLYGEFRVSATRDGDEILELVRDGVLDALSIGFRPVRDRWGKDRATVERLEAALAEVSVVESPAYAGAVITGVRHLPALHTEAARRRLALIERTW